MPEVCVTSYSITHCIYIPGKPGFCFHYHCTVYDECNIYIRFCSQIVFDCLYIAPSHYHHCANLFEDFELEYLPDIFCRMCKIKRILSDIHYTIYRAVCFQFTNFPCNDWENIHCLIIIFKLEVWTIVHYLGVCHGKWYALYVSLYSYVSIQYSRRMFRGGIIQSVAHLLNQKYFVTERLNL